MKVVIIGQDPYYRVNQANGLAFSVNYNTAIPPTLNNIFKELKNDLNNFKTPRHGCLYKWALQGVLLLNMILTVESGKPRSHTNIGWEIFTKQIINIINMNLNGIIFLLWGNYASKMIEIINLKNNYVLTSSHPSPLSAHRGFFGCKHFSKTNFLLKKQNKTPIDWKL